MGSPYLVRLASCTLLISGQTSSKRPRMHSAQNPTASDMVTAPVLQCLHVPMVHPTRSSRGRGESSHSVSGRMPPEV